MARHRFFPLLEIYIYKETRSNQIRAIFLPREAILDSISNVRFVRSWCIAWPSLLTPSLEECSTSDWRLARHGSCPRRAPCPTCSRIIIVEAEESCIESWNYFWQGRWWKERKGKEEKRKKMEGVKQGLLFLRLFVRLLQLLQINHYFFVLFCLFFYLKIWRFSTKFIIV